MLKSEINFAIGFVTGRPNVCNIINAYYKHMLDQAERFERKINITIYVLYDLTYQNVEREDFYHINKEVYESNVKIKYITLEDIKKERTEIINRGILDRREAVAFFGYGHARGRNTLMYFALKDKNDYLLFWDDDEYPYAVEKDENNNLIWKKQDNILEHLNYIENANVTIGYHCGYISPIPYIDYKNEIKEEIFREYIESISNDIINWENIKEKFEQHNGVTFADSNTADGKGAYEKRSEDGVKWVAGSTLCLNLNEPEKIPAFFNPLAARGEDTFFSMRLNESKVIKVPVYHFHDGFLKYTEIMNNVFPTYLRKIGKNEAKVIEERFLQASRGWIKYKPLFLYITDKENYAEKINKIDANLSDCILKINEIFEHEDFTVVLDDFRAYHNRVKEDYKNYLDVNQIWSKLKKNI